MGINHCHEHLSLNWSSKGNVKSSQRREGYSHRCRGARAELFANFWHPSQFRTAPSLSLSMFGHQTNPRDKPFILTIPMWPSWNGKSNSQVYMVQESISIFFFKLQELLQVWKAFPVYQLMIKRWWCHKCCPDQLISLKAKQFWPVYESWVKTTKSLLKGEFYCMFYRLYFDSPINAIQAYTQHD